MKLTNLKKDRKLFFNIGLLFVFIWLLIVSYSSSKRKPDTVGELLNDFSWLQKWPKWAKIAILVKICHPKPVI